MHTARSTTTGLGCAQEEFVKADELCGPMLAGEGPPDWGALMEPFPFFTSYKNYLQVQILATRA